MVPLPDQLPDQFAAVVERFLDRIDSRNSGIAPGPDF
jgi:hypothetical protein